MTDLPHRELPRAPSRRAVVGAAWTVPVIVAASTAPAFAASLAASLAIDTFVAYGADYAVSGRPTRIETKVQVQRLWSDTTPFVKSLTVSVPFPATEASGGVATSITGDGWAFGSVSGSSSTAWTYTFTWTGTLDNSRQSTPELMFLVNRRPVPRVYRSLTAYVTSPQATPTSRTISGEI